MPVFIRFLIKCHWSINSEVLMEKPTRTQPLPVGIVQSPISIKQQFFKDLCTLFPMLPKMTSSEEACHQMSSKVMDPTFLLQLSHSSINGRITCLTIFPSFKILLVITPFNLLALVVVYHFVEVRCIIST